MQFHACTQSAFSNHRLVAPGHGDRVLEQPSVILLPRSIDHRLVPLDAQGVDLVCGAIDLGLTAQSPLHRALPPVVAVPTARVPAITATLDLLFAEVEETRAGRQAAVDRLVEYLLIQLLRDLGTQGEVMPGLLAGLNDARLFPVLTELHQHPARGWTLEQLAEIAAMSRSRFAARFLAVMGQTARDHLTDWRLTLAQKRLLAGQPVNVAAGAVGYQSAAAFIRVFNRRVGESPAGWAAKRRV